MEISTDGGLTYNVFGAYSSDDNTELNWTTTIAVPDNGSEDGNHVIRVKTVDNYNKEKMDFFSVKYDTTAPVLNINNISDGMLITATPFTVNGSSSDNGGSGVTAVQYSMDNSTWSDVTGTVSWSQSVPFTLGLNSNVYFKAIDIQGNESAVVTITLNVDLALPVTDGNWVGIQYKESPFSLTGTASDDLGISTVTVNGVGAGTVNVSGSEGEISRDWNIRICYHCCGLSWTISGL
jgi:hypothetical protein